MNTAKILKDTYYLIDKVGWTQGRYRKRDNNGRIIAYCLSGALNEAALNYSPIEHSKATCSLRDALGYEPTAISVWNDAPERTKQEILDLLSKAIADQKKE